jgi:large subunit ribosomal protein L9
MEVILLSRVEKLGQMGDVVSVKPGFARNYLIPKGFANRATPARIAEFEKMKIHLEAQNLKLRAEAEAISAKMLDLLITFIRSAGETGNLYGSVRTRDISDAVQEAGFTINKNQVHIEHPIKTLGLHTVYIILHPEVRVPIKLNIALSEEEALQQLQVEEEPVVFEEPKHKKAAKKPKKTEETVEEVAAEPKKPAAKKKAKKAAATEESSEE